MRLIPFALILVGFAACSPTVPDSGAEATGVGFGNRAAYLADQEARNAALSGRAAVGIDGAVSPEGVAGAPLSVLRADPGAPTAVASAGSDAAGLAAETRAALGVQAAPAATGAATAAVPTSPTGLSDEQNFAAVAERESIESDRARLEQQRAQFQVVQPGELPDRPTTGTGPNIVAYALATSHPRGQAVYNRSSLFGMRDGRNCNRYSNANEAQEVFLTNGGPERDPQGLDPDGDGYACGWDPSPFRLAAQSQSGN